MEFLNRFTAALKGAAGTGKPSLTVNELSAVHVAAGVRLLAQVAKDYGALTAIEMPGLNPVELNPEELSAEKRKAAEQKAAETREAIANVMLAAAILQNVDALCDWCDQVAPPEGGKGTKLQPVPAAVRRVATVLLAVYWSNQTLADRCVAELHVVIKATEALAKAA